MLPSSVRSPSLERSACSNEPLRENLISLPVAVAALSQTDFRIDPRLVRAALQRDAERRGAYE